MEYCILHEKGKYEDFCVLKVICASTAFSLPDSSILLPQVFNSNQY
jgi:hypothetical protein